MTEQATQHCIDNEHAVAQSAQGDNAFYHYCDIYMGRPSYAVCLHKIECFHADKMHRDDHCRKAINHGTCPALSLLQAEHDAGHALFFIDRAKQSHEIDTQTEELMASLHGRTGYKPLKVTKPVKGPALKLDAALADLHPAYEEPAERKVEPQGLQIEDGSAALSKAIKNRIEKESEK